MELYATPWGYHSSFASIPKTLLAGMVQHYMDVKQMKEEARTKIWAAVPESELRIRPAEPQSGSLSYHSKVVSAAIDRKNLIGCYFDAENYTLNGEQ